MSTTRYFIADIKLRLLYTNLLIYVFPHSKKTHNAIN